MTSNIKDIVANDNMAEFIYYLDSNLWYEVVYYDKALNHQVFKFPVPIEDIGNATFNRVERAMLMMRYIRKHIKTLEESDNG